MENQDYDSIPCSDLTRDNDTLIIKLTSLVTDEPQEGLLNPAQRYDILQRLVEKKVTGYTPASETGPLSKEELEEQQRIRNTWDAAMSALRRAQTAHTHMYNAYQAATNELGIDPLKAEKEFDITKTNKKDSNRTSFALLMLYIAQKTEVIT